MEYRPLRHRAASIGTCLAMAIICLADGIRIQREDSRLKLDWSEQGDLFHSSTPSFAPQTLVAQESPYFAELADGGFYRLRYQSLTYAIVDTNQNEFYDAEGNTISPAPTEGQPYFGSDATYSGNQPSYSDNGDGTVSDEVTGLMWQQVPQAAFYSWTEAQSYAENLVLAGHDDWRLPAIKELLSLADFNGSSRPAIDRPYIDEDFFVIYDPQTIDTFVPASAAGTKRDIDGQFWSSNAYVGRTLNNDSSTFGFNFIDGRIKSYPNGLESGPTGTAFVRCVRGNEQYGKNDFQDNGDGTITDRATGLMWLKNDSGVFPDAGTQGDGAMNWIQALDWTEDLEAAGYSDWRLPNAKELQSIVDYSRAPDAEDPAARSAAIDPIFNLTETESWFWSSTSLGDDLFSWALYLCFGRALAVDTNTELPTINAHGAGAMRSDPKNGEPGDYVGSSGGHGPQNDQVRVYNYVRPVRAASSGGE